MGHGQRASTPGDYFSTQAADYAAYRPRYPAELFAYLASVTPDRRLAWDCATGNGQAAMPLAEYFSHVVATDVSDAQIRRAIPHERVEYRLAPAHASGLAPRSVNLVTVAQALHWFDLDAFYAEVRRVLAPGGVLAVSSYGSAGVDTPALADALACYEWNTLGGYWPPHRELVGAALRGLPFPFPELVPPVFVLEIEWTLAQLLGYTRSWSATARFIEEHGRDPTPELEAALRGEWGPPESPHLIRWPFVVRLGSMGGNV